MIHTTIKEISLASEKIHCYGNIEHRGFLICLDTTTDMDIFQVYSLTNLDKCLHYSSDILGAVIYTDKLLRWLHE